MNYPATPSSTSTFIHTQFQTATDWNLVPQIIWMAKYQQWPIMTTPSAVLWALNVDYNSWVTFPTSLGSSKNSQSFSWGAPPRSAYSAACPNPRRCPTRWWTWKAPASWDSWRSSRSLTEKHESWWRVWFFNDFFSHTCQNSVELSHENYPYPSWLIGFPTMGYDNLNKIR